MIVQNFPNNNHLIRFIKETFETRIRKTTMIHIEALSKKKDTYRSTSKQHS